MLPDPFDAAARVKGGVHDSRDTIADERSTYGEL